jgi:hypothetical protein
MAETVSIELDDPELLRVCLLAHERGLSLNGYINELLRQELGIPEPIYHRIHITEGTAFTATTETGETVAVGPGWLAITEAEYAELTR